MYRSELKILGSVLQQSAGNRCLWALQTAIEEQRKLSFIRLYRGWLSARVQKSGF